MKALSLFLAVLLQAPNPVSTGKAYTLERIADGVYYATATGSMVTGSNNVVVIGTRDVLVVDTGTTPAAARAFIEDLKLLTPSGPLRCQHAFSLRPHGRQSGVRGQSGHHRARLREAGDRHARRAAS